MSEYFSQQLGTPAMVAPFQLPPHKVRRLLSGGSAKKYTTEKKRSLFTRNSLCKAQAHLRNAAARSVSGVHTPREKLSVRAEYVLNTSQFLFQHVVTRGWLVDATDLHRFGEAFFPIRILLCKYMEAQTPPMHPIYACTDGCMNMAETARRLVPAHRFYPTLLAATCMKGCLVGAQWAAKYFTETNHLTGQPNPLYRACRSGNLELVKWIVQHFDLGRTDIRANDNKALHVALHRSWPVAKWLIHHFGLTAKDGGPCVKLGRCVPNGDLATLRDYVDTFDLTDCDVDFFPWLLTAVRDGNAEFVKWAATKLDLNYSSTIRFQFGYVTMEAVKRGDVKVLDAVLRHLQVAARDIDDASDLVANAGSIEVIHCLFTYFSLRLVDCSPQHPPSPLHEVIDLDADEGAVSIGNPDA